MQKLASLLSVLTACAALAASTATAAESGFVSLFNGRDLTGWDGDPRLWTVENGLVVGTCRGPDDFRQNTFLIWRGGEVGDFELRATVRVVGDNNSGLQYRSRPLPANGPWAITGYQCDIHPALEHTGMTYEERGRGIFGLNGRDVVVDPAGKLWLVGEREPVKVDTAAWNDYSVLAVGNRLEHRINGRVTSILVDHDATKRALTGLLAIQLHQGNAHRVEIRRLELRRLSDGKLIPFDRAALPAGATPIERPRTKNPQGVGQPGKARN